MPGSNLEDARGLKLSTGRGQWRRICSGVFGKSAIEVSFNTAQASCHEHPEPNSDRGRERKLGLRPRRGQRKVSANSFGTRTIFTRGAI